MFKTFLFSVLLVFSFSNSPTLAQSDPSYASANDIPYNVFAQLERLQNVSLSPNGRYMAIVYPVQGEALFYVFDLAKENPAAPLRIDTGDVDILWIEWLSNDRILINYGFYAEFAGDEEGWYETRLMAFNRDGSDAATVGHWDGTYNKSWVSISKKAAEFFIDTDDVLSFLPDDPDHILLQIKLPGIEDFGVYKVNVHTDEMIQVQKPMDPVREWYADHQGRVRFGTGFEDGKMVFMIRATPTSEWKRFDNTEMFEDGFDPQTFGFKDEEIFVRASINTGKETLYSFDLSTGAISEKIFEHPTYDARGLVVSRKDQKLLAASYTEDYPELHFFDEDYKKMFDLIGRALQGSRFVILDSTDDGRFHIIRSYSSNDPGLLYYFDRDLKELSPIWEVLPGLDPALLSEVKRVDYLARDGLEISGYLTIPKESDGKNLPTVMLIHGGPWSRDDMTFDAQVQFMASRGYAVFQPNFRGSSGFGDRFEVLGYGEWGLSMQDDIMDGLNWLVREGITDPGRVCIAGGSYGGYAALMGVGRDPDTFKCAFAFAPVTDIRRLMDDADKRGNANFYRRTVTPGMDRKEFASISPVKFIKKITTPILLIHGDDDSRVPIKHSQKMAKDLKKRKKDFDFITLEGAGHGIIEEKHRMTYYKALEDFLAKHLGGGR